MKIKSILIGIVLLSFVFFVSAKSGKEIQKEQMENCLQNFLIIF